MAVIDRPVNQRAGAPAHRLYNPYRLLYLRPAMTVKAAEREAAHHALLEELKTAAEKLGLQVREERLLREVGYRVRSGHCRLRTDEIIFLERGLPVQVHIDVLVEELARRSLDDVYLSPAARALVERAAARETLRDDGQQAHSG